MVIYYHEYFYRKHKIALKLKIMDSDDVLRIYMEAFSENLKRLRKEKYNTMNEVSVNSEIDASNYNKFEKSKGNPTIKTLLKIASAFEIPPKELFDFEFDITKYRIDE